MNKRRYRKNRGLHLAGLLALGVLGPLTAQAEPQGGGMGDCKMDNCDMQQGGMMKQGPMMKQGGMMHHGGMMKHGGTPAAFRELLDASLNEKVGLTFFMDGQAVPAVVTKINDDGTVEGRSQQYDRIVIRMRRVNAIAK